MRKKNAPCGCGYDWAEPCAALLKKSAPCGCDWAEPCAALRKKSVNCDWAEPCAALRKKSTTCDMRLRLGRTLRCAAQEKYDVLIRLNRALRRAVQ